jgi:FtsP/CotA-like multicopper oxidase with cupredoxin domain
LNSSYPFVSVSALWFLPAPANLLAHGVHQPDNGGGQEPVADVGTINGRGRCSARAPNPEECPQDVPWAVINVQQGKKYRMRFINNSGFGHFHVRFENHSQTVMELDGVLHQPHEVDEVEIYAGQRYSAIVRFCSQPPTAAECVLTQSRLGQIDANQPIGNYWIMVSRSSNHISRRLVAYPVFYHRPLWR